MDFEVIVQPKQEVLDPQGRSIQKALSRVGFPSLQAVKVSKRYLLSIDADLSADPEQEAITIARKHLANPVAETFHVKRL